MSQQEYWLKQRAALLRKPIRELKTNALQEEQARKQLSDKHQLAARSISRSDALEWAQYVTMYTQELTNLSSAHQQQREVLYIRQKQETAKLEEYINKAQSWDKRFPEDE